MKQRRCVRFPRLDALSRGCVSDGRCVVLVRQPREMMTELMYENIVRKSVIDCHRAVQVEDSAAAIGASVHENLDKFVRRKLRHFPKTLIVERKNVTLRSERIVGCERIAINTRRRPRDSGLRRGWTQTPDIEIRAMLFERRSRKQDCDQSSRVSLKLSEFAGGVTVAEQKQIDLRGRIAHLLNRNQPGRRAWL